MQQGYLCTSADPRRIGPGGGETIILNSSELRKAITLQQTTDDQTLWMPTAQAGFPLTRDEEEVTNGKDAQMGRITVRYLHPAISSFITDWVADLTSSGKQPSPLEQAAIDLENEWSQKYITGIWEASTDPPPSPASWELDPPPLTANHPPRITDSNTRITLREGSLKEPLPKSDNGLGWVQIQQKSLRWEELIQDSPIITHEGLTTLAHPNRGWTITSGTWNTLRAKWGLTSETLQRIHDSCSTQRQLETVNIFTPTRYILQTIKRIWQVEGIHGLPAVTVPTFFPTDSRNNDTWWERREEESSSIKTPRDESGETEYSWGFYAR